MTNPLIVTHYADGRPSETREMTDEELADIPEQPLVPAINNTSEE